MSLTFVSFLCENEQLQNRLCCKGGLSTQEEMCLTYAYYYPRTPLFHCLTVALYMNVTSGKEDKVTRVVYIRVGS